MRRALTYFLAVSLWTSFAWADEDPRRAQAESMMKDGIALHDKGKEEDALAQYKRAYDVYPTPNILFAIATSEQALNRPVEAIRHLREAMRAPTLHPNNQAKGKEYIRDLETKVGQVLVKTPAETTLLVDGKKWDGKPGEPIDVAPGDHVIEASLKGKTKREPVTATAGKQQTVTLSFEEGDVTSSPPPVVSPQTESGGTPTAKIVTVAALGVGGVAGLVLAGVFKSSADSKVDESRALLNGASCVGVTSAQCTQAKTLQDDYESASTMSTVCFVGGAVLLAGGVAAWLLWPKPSSATGVRVLPTINGVVGSF